MVQRSCPMRHVRTRGLFVLEIAKHETNYSALFGGNFQFIFGNGTPKKQMPKLKYHNVITVFVKFVIVFASDKIIPIIRAIMSEENPRGGETMTIKNDFRRLWLLPRREVSVNVPCFPV